MDFSQYFMAQGSLQATTKRDNRFKTRLKRQRNCPPLAREKAAPGYALRNFLLII
jgi:hypothetical protein